MDLLPSKPDLIEFLSSVEFFKDLNKSALKTLVEDFEPVYLRGQETLLHEGDLGDDMFVVVHGRLRVFLHADKENEEAISEVGAREAVGEIAILVDKPRTATVKAIRDTVLIKLSKKNYYKFVNVHPESGLNMAKACIERLLKVAARGKTSKNVSTVAFIPLQDSAPSIQLITKLAEVLGKSDKTLLITKELAEASIGNIQNIINESEKFEKLLRFLNDQENKYRYVLYQADSTYSHWTELCTRQADVLYIIKDGQSVSSASSEIEDKILRQKSISSRVSLILRHKTVTDSFVDVYEWIRKHEINDYFHVDAENVDDIARIVRLITGNSIGLVLSGGGARGLAHVGVIRALEQAKIPIDIIGGTSAGSLIAGAYAMGCGSHEIERLCNQFLSSGSRFDITFPYVSLTTGRSLVRVLKNIFGTRRIEELRTRMFSIASNITKNEIVVFDTGPLWEALRASISLPGIYPPVFKKGDLLVDGAVLNNLPVDIMNKKFNAGKVIASLVLMESDRYKSTIVADTLSGWQVLSNKLNPYAKKMHVPRIDTILMRTMILNQLQHQLAQADQADFSFLLNLGNYGLMDFKEYKNVIEEGYRQAIELLKDIDINKL